MAFVQAYTFDAGESAPGDGSLAFSVPVSAGDFLVAVLATDDIRRESGAVTTDDMRFPPGWVVVWMDGASPTGDPRRRRAVAAVATFAAASAGTAAGTVRWPLFSAYALDRELVVLRYSGVKTVVGSAATVLNNQKALYPSVAGAASGHVVRVADVVFSSGDVSPDTLAGQCVPAGHTQRAVLSTGMPLSRVVVSDAAVASGGPAGTVTGAGAARTNGWGVTLYLGSTIGPSAPTILDPRGSADLAAAHTIRWTPDGAQTAYAVRRRLYSGGTPGAWQWWSGTDWSASSETWTTSTATTLAQAAGLWSSGGAVYDVQVATKGDAAHPDGSTYAGVQVTSRPSPTTSSVTVTPLTGTTITSRVPVVAVAGTAGSGAALTGAEVRIVDAATPTTVLAQGSHAPGGSWTVPLTQALPNDVYVTVQGRVVQTGDQPGAWVELVSYRVLVPTPPAPTVSWSVVTHPVSGLPGVRLSIGTTGAVKASIERDGVALGEWGTPGTLQWEDYTLPLDTPTVYAVRAVDAASPPNVSPATAATVTLPGASPDAHCWLIDLLDPSTAVHTHLVDAAADVIDLRSSVFEPLGRADRIVRSGVPSQETGSWTLTCEGPGDLDRMLALLRSGRRLVFRSGPETHLKTRATYPGLSRAFRPVGEVSITRPAHGPWTRRDVTFSWVAQ